MFISIFVFVWLLILVFLNFVFNILLNRQIKAFKIKVRNLSISVRFPGPKVIPPFPVRFESLFVLQEEDSKHEIDSVIIISSIASVGGFMKMMQRKSNLKSHF